MATVAEKTLTEQVADFLKTPEADGLTDVQVAERLKVGKATVYHAKQLLKDGPKMDIRMVDPNSLIVDERFQVREGLDALMLGRYRERFRNGEQPPPLLAFETAAGLVLIEGHGRAWAAINEEVPAVPVEVRTGSEADMFLAAACANADHGVPLTNAEVDRAIAMVLEHIPGADQWPHADVAAACKTTVRQVRKFRDRASLPANKDSQPPKVVVERNGKTFEMTKPPGRPKAPEPEANGHAPEAVEQVGRPETPDEALDREVLSILDRSPLYARLGPHQKAAMRIDVRVWLKHRKVLDDIHAELRRIIGRRIKGEPIGQFIAALEPVLRLPHPLGGKPDASGRPASAWLGCSDCQDDSGVHTGMKPDGRHPCPSCKGRGYSIPGAN